FSINNSGQSLSINSKTENVTAPVDVILKDFHIKTLTNLAEQDSLPVDGVINGNVLVKNMMSSPVFTSDISIDTLTYNTDTVGNIKVKVDNETANAYNADVAITGNGNDVKLAGKYYTGESRMDLKLNINNFNMASVKPFTFGALTQADGSLKGEVSIKGTTTAPDVNGSLRFENANITPAATGAKLYMSNEAISVSSSDISFDRFTLVDSAGKKAIVDGNIFFSKDFKTYTFDMDLTADDFQVLNEPKRQNAIYYGRLNMDADISVEGTLTAPKINADLKINKGTDITFVLPSSNPEVESRDGVVQFVNVYGGKTDSIFTAAIDTLTQYPKLAGLDITGTLESDTAAQITLIIDERSGDALKIRGKADLAGGLDKSGKISLTGNYELQNGSYQLSLSLLKREFIIQPGSVITWTGDPKSATVDITAIYIANTQPVNLLQSELANSSDINKYKEKVPFDVLLKMKGELLKPVITFDIQLPENQKSRWAEVETKLEQVRRDDAELNKQVFALLLLGRFVQENPLENSADATSLASMAKSSVSRILAEQLNNLAGSLIKGVDLNFGVNSEDDYSTGTRTNRTDLTVGVSKSLLNDRLRVSVGSNFQLEGSANTQNASNIAGDVAIDYLLTKDNRYTLRVYRRNGYDGVLQVIENGVAFIFTFDFNEFKQILNRKTAEQKLIDKAEKAKRKAKEKVDNDKKAATDKKNE
ncbi:MAG: translocation/assembly module TamB domain-containing protein, partial [Ferruginibacter sp.]